MKKYVLSIVTGFLAVVMVYSAVMMVKELLDRKKEISDFDRLVAMVQLPEPEFTTETKPHPVEEAATVPTLPEVVHKRDLTPLAQKNPDFFGWVYIDGTTVDYPVMYTPQEPQKYLRKNFDGEYSIAGVPFLEANCDPQGEHLILYGHNMKNGTMFSDITEYVSQDYWREHSVVEFETVEGLREYDIFAVLHTTEEDPWYGIWSFDTRYDFDELMSALRENALYDTGIKPQYGQQLISLSTCYGSSKADRIIIVGTEKTE